MRLAAVIGVVGISYSAIFVRFAAVSPSTSAFFRCAYALPVLLGIWHLRRGDAPMHRRGLAFGAGIILGLDLFLWHHAIEMIGAGLSTVVGNSQVIVVALLAWAIHGERPSRLAGWVVPFVLGGIVLVSGLGHGDAYGARPVLGAAFGALTGILYGLFLVLYRHANRVRVHASGPLLDATAGAACITLILGLAGGDLDLVPGFPAHGWLLALALISQTAAWICISTALPRLPALQTSILLLVQPVLTIVWGALWCNEYLSSVQATGGLLVLGGVAALSVQGAMREHGVEAPADKPGQSPD
ncbi:MAG: EamA family transporter [Planctomycetes bacterium]|nr:EamA family transporter [Planctomycetota bacterium]